MNVVHPYAPHDVISYFVSNFEVNWTNGSWDISTFVSSPWFPNLTIIWPSETWPQNWLHNNSSPSLPRPQPMPLLVHWQLGWHPSACLSMTGTPKMPITPSPYFTVAWRTGSSSTTSCQRANTTSDMSLLPWEPNPWKYMHNGCQMAAKRNRKQPRWKLLPYLTKSNREWHMTSTPLCTLENLKILWPGQERTPKILSHASRHWWTTARWSMMSIMSTNCIVISSVHTARRENSLGNLWQSNSRHPPASWLILLWTTLPSNSLPSARTKCKWPTPATTAMVTHHLHPPRTVPTAPNSTQLAEQTAWHMIPVVPNATKWNTGDPNAVMASHSNQGLHLLLGHSRGSSDAHLGTTTTAMGRVTRQTP